MCIMYTFKYTSSAAAAAASFVHKNMMKFKKCKNFRLSALA